jgi:hypothetical protein
MSPPSVDFCLHKKRCTFYILKRKDQGRIVSVNKKGVLYFHLTQPCHCRRSKGFVILPNVSDSQVDKDATADLSCLLY